MTIAKLLNCVGIFSLVLPLTLFLVHQPQNIRQYAAADVQPFGQSSGRNMIFDDEFDGSSLDLSKWTPNWFGSSYTAITSPLTVLRQNALFLVLARLPMVS
jgi:hypothetical protein